ncbi:SDR family NAD(P)-dependent oxidoreductase [Streptacidiphilus monticola]|jgi:NAD(P)-dependent dehydrogenase (short-subunit alcohol dehydrogenase family)|uniref:SDR family NAD(P)-dependent oxidoreductase n=1 Tax=Streptacidiphilus monticola TaxID=2161674 RepID=A0ABW1FV56_9ACTN
MSDPSTVLITGATDGLGRALALRLAESGTRLLLHGRNPERGDQVRREVVALGAPEPVLLLADLAARAEVDRLAAAVQAVTDRLDVLVNNAGVGFGAPGAGRELSPDGVELRFAVNYLAVVRLTRRLLPLLRRSAPARIVNVASAGQFPLDFGDLMLDRDYDGVTAYRRAKLAEIMFTFDLAEELGGTGVTVNALHPASFMDTSMVRESGVGPHSSVEEGLAATLPLVEAESLAGVSGRYFNGRSPARALDQAYDPDARRRLREATAALLPDLG